jgi:hypothetical protein
MSFIVRVNVCIAVHLVSPENIKYVNASVPASGDLLPVANDLTVRSAWVPQYCNVSVTIRNARSTSVSFRKWKALRRSHLVVTTLSMAFHCPQPNLKSPRRKVSFSCSDHGPTLLSDGISLQCGLGAEMMGSALEEESMVARLGRFDWLSGNRSDDCNGRCFPRCAIGRARCCRRLVVLLRAGRRVDE